VDRAEPAGVHRVPGIDCDPDVYEVTATVTADSTNAVDESNETNSSRSRTFGPG
jgi:hypothetical protein